MGTIREPTKKNGEKSYHAEVRFRGHHSERDSFRTRTAPKKWIQDTEPAIRWTIQKLVNLSQTDSERLD